MDPPGISIIAVIFIGYELAFSPKLFSSNALANYASTETGRSRQEVIKNVRVPDMPRSGASKADIFLVQELKGTVRSRVQVLDSFRMFGEDQKRAISHNPAIMGAQLATRAGDARC